MFAKDQLDALFGQVRAEFGGRPDYEQLIRDAHLGVALSDAGRPLDGTIDPRVVALILKHRPEG